MKNEKDLIKIGRFMSLILRHKPEEAGIQLDEEGWTDVTILLQKLKITQDELDWIVENNNKKRFGYNDSKSKIRASQGHSIEDVKIQFTEVTDAPDFLYHGTSAEVFPILLKEGIKKMSRTHVHLSKDLETATAVGKRKGHSVVLIKIKAKEMLKDGQLIYLSDNGVYLSDYVPAEYLDKEPIYLKL